MQLALISNAPSGTFNYHLWLHWRPTGLFLAWQFLDYEPGIHWSQMQVQSGTTGINTLRMYSPTKQAQDQDPQRLFIRRWLPAALARVPLQYLAEPWKMDVSVQRMAGCAIGVDYPFPSWTTSRRCRPPKTACTACARPQRHARRSQRRAARHGSSKSSLLPLLCSGVRQHRRRQPRHPLRSTRSTNWLHISI